ALVHALLDVVYAESDPGALMTHLDEGVEERYWTCYPIRHSYRAALLVAARANTPLDTSVAVAIVNTVAKLAHIATSELDPLGANGRPAGLAVLELDQLETLIARLKHAAVSSSLDRMERHA